MLDSALPTPSFWDAENRTTRRGVLLTLLLLVWALGLLLLDAKSLWLDEANGLRVTHLGLTALWAGQTEQYHPPLFYWLLGQWMALGNGEFLLRFPSVVFSTLSVLVAYRLARTWFGRAVALTAALLVAFSPVLIWYAQELRPYALLVLMGLITTVCATQLLLRPSANAWLLYAISVTAAIYLHYFALLLFGVHAVAWIALLAVRRTAWRTGTFLLAAWGAAFMAYWPWMQTPAFAAFLRLPTDSSNYVAILLTQRFGVPAALMQYVNFWLALAAVGGVAMLALLYWALRAMHRRHYWDRLRSQRWLQVVAAALFALFLIAFVVPRAYTAKRQLLLLVPYLLLAFAWWWPWHARRRWLLATLAVLSLAAALTNVLLIPKNQWREAAAYIGRHAQPTDLVLLTPSYMTIPYELYAPAEVAREGLSYALDEAALTTLQTQHDRIWLIVDPFDTDPDHHLQQWLDEHAHLAETVPFYRLDVQLYTPAAP